jgi:SAM-dependent methyltransferase
VDYEMFVGAGALSSSVVDVARLCAMFSDRGANPVLDPALIDTKPLDRDLLNKLADRVHGIGPVCDMGCGPGHVARYLDGRGVQVVGVDLSPAMVHHARTLNPSIEFNQGDMRALNIEDGAWGGIAAFYSIIHIPRTEVVDVLGEMKRALRPGGLLLLAFHIGDDVLHLDEWWGQQVSVDFNFFRPEEMTDFLRSAGFQVGEIVEREPYEGVEHPSRRAYIFAEKPRSES